MKNKVLEIAKCTGFGLLVSGTILGLSILINFNLAMFIIMTVCEIYLATMYIKKFC